jgi:DNA-binding Lrp family transcriptional regulator
MNHTGRGAQEWNAQTGAATERKIIKALNGSSGMELSEIAALIGMTRSCVWLRVHALVKRGAVKEAGKGHRARLFALCEGYEVDEELDEDAKRYERELAKKKAAAARQPIFRHPQDVAFFGHYRGESA